MQPQVTRKYKTLLLICVFTSIAGVVYQLVNENLLDHRSILVGLPLGVVFGILELFLFPKITTRIRNWSFTKMLLFKTLLYTLVIFGVTISITLFAGWTEGRSLNDLPPFLSSAQQLILVIYTLVVYGLLLFLLQVNHLLGEGVLWKFLAGKYHKPREEERIFMFLDMKSSTTIAEQLGHVRFYSLLNQLFQEISEPVLQTKAEIYQYVGDEVILSWTVLDGLENSNCLNAYFIFKDILQQNSRAYFKNFGIEPEFKAGLHFGKVVCAQIGDLKREIVYNGDVLNTTARIRSECRTYQRDCLVSGALKKELGQGNRYHWEKLDTIALRGKETEVELFSVTA